MATVHSVLGSSLQHHKETINEVSSTATFFVSSVKSLLTVVVPCGYYTRHQGSNYEIYTRLITFTMILSDE